MQVKLFVGNLPWSVGDAELEEVFSPLGQVASARVITDRDTGRSRGFGFVEMEVDDVATVISGGRSSTTALHGSTETQQFSTR